MALTKFQKQPIFRQRIKNIDNKDFARDKETLLSKVYGHKNDSYLDKLLVRKAIIL